MPLLVGQRNTKEPQENAVSAVIELVNPLSKFYS
jgi:hypothetical protein